MVKISPWGSPNLQYLDMGVGGQKDWKTLKYGIISDEIEKAATYLNIS